MRFRRYVRLPRVRLVGAAVYVHWTAWAVPLVLLAISWRRPEVGLIAAASYLLIIVAHEAGHALAARRFDVRATAIHLGFMHGRCSFDAESTYYLEKEELIVAWGGVLAQAAIAAPILVAHALTGFGDIYPFQFIVKYLGTVNLLIAAFNLLPFPGADGEKAWRLLPLLWSEWRGQRKPKRRKIRSVR